MVLSEGSPRKLGHMHNLKENKMYLIFYQNFLCGKSKQNPLVLKKQTSRIKRPHSSRLLHTSRRRQVSAQTLLCVHMLPGLGCGRLVMAASKTCSSAPAPLWLWVLAPLQPHRPPPFSQTLQASPLLRPSHKLLPWLEGWDPGSTLAHSFKPLLKCHLLGETSNS